MEPALEAVGRPKKRRKVQEACTACRRRKTRCDGRKPVCVACEDRGVAPDCEYQPIRNATSPHHVASMTPSTHAYSWTLSTPAPAPATSSVERTGHTSLLSDTERASGSPTLLSVPSYTATDELYGPASNVSFSRSVVPQIRQNELHSRHRATQSTHQSAHECSQVLQTTQSLLPLRKTADDLVRCYFDLIWPFLPVLHRPSFMKRYELLFNPKPDTTIQGSPLDESLFLSITNLVFALGSQCSSLIALEQRRHIADDFFQRAQKPCIVTYLDSPSLSSVQMYLLSAIYLQSVDAGRCWYFTGTAIRVAQALGFHAEPRPNTQQTRAQLKLRRHIWHTCVTFDRLTAMGFGRPTMIQSGTPVSLPAAIDKTDKVDTNDYLSGEYDELALFVYSCKLFDILHDVLQHFYPSDRPSLAADNYEGLVSQTLDIVRRLDKLEGSVPVYLRADGNKQVDITAKFSVLYLQQQVLYCRFLFVRTLALRPLLLQSVRLESASPGERVISKLTSSLDAAVIRQSYQDCVQASCQLVEALYINLDTPYRNSPWHTVYLVFSAATILLAAQQSKSIDTNAHETQFERTWQQGFGILRHHAPHLTSAGRALEVLHAMRENLFSGHSNEDAAIRPPNQHWSGVNNAMGIASEANPDIATSSAGSIDDIGDIDFQAMSEDWLDQFIADMSWLEVPQVARS